MYFEFFNLRSEPFSITPDPEFLYLGYQHETALASLLYGVKYRKGFMALIGEVGTGKSTICRALSSRVGLTTDVAVILNPVLSVEGLLAAINRDFGIQDAGTGVEARLEVFNRFVLDAFNQGRNAVVIIDEAQHLSPEAMEMVRLLSNLETNQQKLLQIILVGQPELETKLKAYALRQLNQRVGIRARLAPFTFDDLKKYVYHRLFVASGRKTRPHTPRKFTLGFRRSALRVLYALTRGNPRLINVACDRALLLAYARRRYLVTREMIAAAWREVSDGAEKPAKKSLWRFWPAKD